MYGDDGRLDGRTVLFCMVTTDGRTLHKNSTDWIKNILIGSLKIKVVGLLCTWYVLGIVRCRIVLVPVSTLLKYQKFCLDEHVVAVFSILMPVNWKIKFFFRAFQFWKILLAVSSVAVAVGVVLGNGKYCCLILKNVPNWQARRFCIFNFDTWKNHIFLLCVSFWKVCLPFLPLLLPLGAHNLWMLCYLVW